MVPGSPQSPHSHVSTLTPIPNACQALRLVHFPPARLCMLLPMPWAILGRADQGGRQKKLQTCR